MIADCVVEYVTENTRDIWFSKNDIWHSSYAEEYVRDIFNKPSTSKELSKNEYDKFFSQPLEMLASAGVLKKKKENRINYYKVSDFHLLEYMHLEQENQNLTMNMLGVRLFICTTFFLNMHTRKYQCF